MRKHALAMSIAACLVVTAVYLSRAAEAPVVKQDVEPRVTSRSVAIYDKDPSHLWNRLHAAIFVRTMDKGETTGHDTVDPLLWLNTSEHLLKGESHESVIRILDEFLARRGEKLFDKPLPRAVLQHDLWAAYDWAATRAEVAPEASRALRVRLAKAMDRLALSTDEIKQLRDNYAHDVKAGKWPAEPDPKRSGAPFLPPGFFDEASPWVCVSGQEQRPSSMVHLTYFCGRSAFLAFLWLPGGRTATLAYLDDLNKKAAEIRAIEPNKVFDQVSSLPAFPIGTRVALVRRMLLIDQSGTIVPSPIVQSIQLRVFVRDAPSEKERSAEQEQEVHKFKISRSALLSEEGTSMKPIGPHVMSLFGLVNPSEELRGHTAEIKTCAQCHEAITHNIGTVFSFNQGILSNLQNVDLFINTYPFEMKYRPQLKTVKIADELSRTIRWKTSRNDWSMLNGTRDALRDQD